MRPPNKRKLISKDEALVRLVVGIEAGNVQNKHNIRKKTTKEVVARAVDLYELIKKEVLNGDTHD
jgi:hypothetical protein